MTTTAGLSPRTVIQLPVTRQLAGQYLANTVVPGSFEPSALWGLCSRLVDVIDAESGAAVRAHHGLAGAEADFPVGDGLFVLRFQAHWPELFRASFGGRSTAAAARLGSTLVLPAPFLGTGYTEYLPVAVPEYWLELTEAPVGAELWHLAEDGAEGWEQPLARYSGRHSGWHAFPAAEDLGLPTGPVVPAPGGGGVARGLMVTFQGTPHLADFGPNPGEATAYRAAEDGTTLTRRLEFAQCEEVGYRRLLMSWRGAPFEVLATTDGIATLALTSGNAEEAAWLGLSAAGRHAWRARVPADDLDEMTEELRPLAAPGPAR